MRSTDIATLRSAERAYYSSGDEQHLDLAFGLVQGAMRATPFALATGVWLRLLRYDRGDGDRYLNDAVDICASRGWDDPTVLSVSVAALLRRCARDGDLGDLDMAIGLPRPQPSGPPLKVPVWRSDAWRKLDIAAAYLERYRLRDTGDDLERALATAREAVAGCRDQMVRAIGLGRLAACEHEKYLGTGRRSLLMSAVRRYEQALRLTGPEFMDRRILQTELGTAVQDRFAEDQDAADLDLAVCLAESARSGATGPDTACHIVNLGTALNTRYEVLGAPADLDGAVRRWREALDALPAASPYRAAFFDRLALGLLAKWQSLHSDDRDLDHAVEYGRAALRHGATSPFRAIYACHLAEALEYRYHLRRESADLHEAVQVYEAEAEALDNSAARTPDLLSNLAATLLARYRELGTAADIERAVEVLGRLSGRRLSRGNRSTVAASVAHALTMRYRADGSPEDLHGAISAARKALVGIDRRSVTWNSRSARLGHLLYLRYLARGRRSDLDTAITLAQQIVDDSEPGGGHLATPEQIGHLAIYLVERYERTGDLADWAASVAYGRRGQKLDDREESPHLVSNVAAAIHARFPADGRLDALDQIVERYRQAVAAEAPTSPDRPVTLNNLGIALQDRYIYGGDEDDLAKAIDVHEQAVGSCPAGSPDRPGLLSTLSSAIQLRYEREGMPADLKRAIELDEEALNALHPSAPERVNLLNNIAAARHLDARRTRDAHHLGMAVAAFGAALRRTPPGHPARSRILSGRASALADRYDWAPHRHRRKQVLDAYSAALAACENVPVMMVDCAVEYAEWATRHRLWAHAACACRAAAKARQALAGAQLDPAHRDSWLARADMLGAVEVYARVRSGNDLPNAVVALESGRALGLSEALDARTIVDRLCAAGRHELADKYRSAAERVARLSSISATQLRHGPVPSPTPSD